MMNWGSQPFTVWSPGNWADRLEFDAASPIEAAQLFALADIDGRLATGKTNRTVVVEVTVSENESTYWYFNVSVRRNSSAVDVEFLSGPETPGWEPVPRWVDDGDGYVIQVWEIKGDEPFGGLRCRDEQNAINVCHLANMLTGRRVAPPQDHVPEPCPVAEGVAQALRAAGHDVVVNGSTFTICTKDGSPYNEDCAD